MLNSSQKYIMYKFYSFPDLQLHAHIEQAAVCWSLLDTRALER